MRGATVSEDCGNDGSVTIVTVIAVTFASSAAGAAARNDYFWGAKKDTTSNESTKYHLNFPVASVQAAARRRNTPRAKELWLALWKGRRHDNDGGERRVMAKYCKKSIVIEAVQFWQGKSAPEGVCRCPRGRSNGAPHIHTLEGIHQVSDGDWIITGIEGENYACRSDMFDATYEPAQA